MADDDERATAAEVDPEQERAHRQAQEVVRAIEAIVMVADQPVEPGLLAQLLEIPAARVEELADALAASYAAAGHGFALVRVAGGYRFQSHPDLAPYVERFVLEGQSARLSAAALETLAIIAYKQPISRAQVASIRGVDPDGVMRTLTQRGYIEPVAKDPGPGQAALFGTTRTFLERLGLDSLAQLPPIADFVPGADVVEALDHTLRPQPAPAEAPLEAPADAPRGRAGRAGRPRSGARRRWGADRSANASDDGERLQKVLARAGLGSRRVCEDLIAEGRVTVDGEVAELGRRVDVEHDHVAVDGVPIGVRPGLVHYLLNKPAGVVTTAADTHGRPTVVELVPAEPRVFPVGRLDADTEGLLLLTNDGDLAHRLTHPSFGIEKEYLVSVRGAPTRAALRVLREGVELEDGRTAPARVAEVEPGLLRITIHEGRNRQVRRMCEAVGHPVERLVRTRIGPLAERRLAPGAWRPLEQAEVLALERAVAAGPRGERPSGRGGTPH